MNEESLLGEELIFYWDKIESRPIFLKNDF